MEVCGLGEEVSTPEEDLWWVGLGGGDQGGGTVSTRVSLVQTTHLDRFAVSVLELENSVVFFGIDL